MATVWAIVVTVTVGFANIFTILQPAIESKDYVSTGFQLAGPIVFSLVAFYLIIFSLGLLLFLYYNL